MNFREKLVALTWRLDSHVLRHMGGGFPVLIVNEFPKSGGTWIAKMLASALDLPLIEGGIFIPSMPCVIRTMWLPDSRYDPTVYVMRDCRDVMISLFHHRIRNRHRTPKLNSLYRKRLGDDLAADKIGRQLGGFIEVEFENNVSGSRQNWDRHLQCWWRAEKTDNQARRCVVRYEDALESPDTMIYTVLNKLFQLEISPEKIRLVADLHDKNLGTQRLNTSSASTFFRKGITGEWKSVFSSESGEILAKYVNRTLIDAGYESDPDWWKKLS